MSTLGITPVMAPAASRRSQAGDPCIRLIYGVIFVVVLLALFGGGAARYAIPVITTAAAYKLYRKSPPLYVSFVWWLFFLICVVRRIVDYRAGYSEVNAVLAAPYLAALVCSPTVFARSDVWRLRISFPFILAFTASLYGLLVGLLFTPAKNLVVSGLAWFCPLVFGFYMLTEMTSQSRRDEHFAALEKTFLWGTLIMGCYGVYQFVTAPRWDVIWMTETLPRMGSIGSPDPYEIRVFSTMNGPGALAYALATGLLLLLVRRRSISMVAAATGFSALLLSSVRAAWGTLAIMLVLFAFREKRYLGKLMAATGLLVACASVAMLIPPLSERLQNRFATFGNIRDDQSYQERTSGYEEMLGFAADTPLGDGLGILDAKFQGKTSIGARDSGIWEIVLSLGWIGAAIYFTALGALAWTAWNTRASQDSFHSVSVCIAIGLLAQIPMGTVVGLTGMTIWTFGAIAIAPRSPLVTA